MNNFLHVKSIHDAAPLWNAARIISIMILTLLWPARGEAQELPDLDVSSSNINGKLALTYKPKSGSDTYAWHYRIAGANETEFSGTLTGTNENWSHGEIEIKSEKEATAPDYADCATLQLNGVTLTNTADAGSRRFLFSIANGTKPVCIRAIGESASKLSSTGEAAHVIRNNMGGILLLDGGDVGLNIDAPNRNSTGIYLAGQDASPVEGILKGKIDVKAAWPLSVSESSNAATISTTAGMTFSSSGTRALNFKDKNINSPFLEWQFNTAPASGQTLEIKDASGQPLDPAVKFTTDGKAKNFGISAANNTDYTLWLGDEQQMSFDREEVFSVTDNKVYTFSGVKKYFLAVNWAEYGQTADVGSRRNDVAVSSDNTKYTVYTPAGLAWIAWVTNSGKKNADEADKYYPATAGFAGCTVTLANNISLTAPTTGVVASGFDANWPTIGKENSKSFKGTFDGGSHKVSGLSITIPNDCQFTGLFGYINGADIKNLRVEGEIEGTSSMGNSICVGGIVGMAEKSKIIACSNAVGISVTTTATNYELNIGGIVGLVGSGCNIYSCWNEATLSGESSQVLYIGGIVGTNSTPIKNCYSSGDVSGKGTSTSECASGGIAGCIRAALSNCYATGSVSATATTNNGTASAGGIAGYIHTTGSIWYCLALNAGNKISAKSSGGSNYKGRIVGHKGEGEFISISNNYASTKIMLSDDGTNFTAPITEIGANKINGADVYLDDVADAIASWTGSENTKAFTAIDTVAVTGMLPQLKAIASLGEDGLPATYGNSTMADQPSFTTSGYLGMPTALELPAESTTITLSFSDGKWRYQKEGVAPTRFTGTVKMAEGVNKAEIALVVSTTTGNPTLTFDNVKLSTGSRITLLTINENCVLTLHTTGDKPLTIEAGEKEPVLVNKGTLRVTGTGLFINKKAGESYGLVNSGTFIVPDPTETSVLICSWRSTISNDGGKLDNAWIEWQFDSRPSKIAFAATNQSPDVQEFQSDNYATPVTPGKTYRLWKVTGDSPGEVRTRQAGTKDSKTVALFPAPAVGEKAVYTDVKNVEEVTIADSQNFSTACSEKNVIVGTSGVLTIDNADAQVINLTLEKDAQVVTMNPLKVDGTFSTTRSLDNEWIAFGSPVAMKASVKKEDNDSLLYVGTGYTDVAPSKQVWENVSGIPDTGTKTADLAADHPYLLAADAPSTKVTFTATAGTDMLEIPKTATVTPGSALADGVFLFRTNPNLSNLTLSNIYVLNAEGDRFELHPGDYDVKPFEAYITANEETCSRVRSLKIGDNIATGIDRPLTADTRIWGTRGTLHISADAPADVLIVTPAGRTLRSLKASAGETTLALPSGIYFVRCNGITYKISL